MPFDLTNDSLELSIVKSVGAVAPLEAVSCSERLQSIADRQQLGREIANYVRAAVSDNTRRAYRQDLADFEGWGGTVPCAPEILAAFIADRARTLSPYSLVRRVIGIGKAHTSRGFPDPSKNDLVSAVLRGVRRSHSIPQRQAAPLLKQDLLSLLPLMCGTKGLRDRALILLGFAAALRRSELVSLNCSDLRFVSEGMIVTLQRSKTDQIGEGRKIAVPWGRTQACPVKAVRDWIDIAGIAAGPLFRAVSKGGDIGENRLTAQSVALIVKAYARAIGLPAADYSGHSLRAGLVTSAAMAGVASHRIMAQTGHRSLEMVNRYIREANAFADNASGAVL